MLLTSDADVELISAYLDNQITPSEQATLENRLAHDPALQQLLGDMRDTVGMLRALDPVRPPRSFALDLATVPAARGWAVPALWLRFGSALAVLLLGVTLTLDLSAGSNSASLSTSAAPAAGGFAPAVAEGAATSAPAMEAPAVESRVAIAAEATAAAAASNASIAALGVTAAAGKQAADAMQADAAPAPTDEVASAQSGALSANAGISDPQSSSPSTGSFEAQTTAPVSAPPPAHPLLLVEIGFGALALLLLLASFFVTRRRS